VSSIENKQNYRFKIKSAGTVFTFHYCLIRVPPSARLPRVSPLIHSPSKIECRMTETGHNPLWINLDLAIEKFFLLLFIYSLSCVKFSLRTPRKRVQGVEVELNSFLNTPSRKRSWLGPWASLDDLEYGKIRCFYRESKENFSVIQFVV